MAEKMNGSALREEGQKWLNKIKASYEEEESWFKDAEHAVAAYTGEYDGIVAPDDTLGDGRYDYNILYANVETIVPAIINSPPAPDIRRRFNDDDPIAKDVSELLERAIKVQIDDSEMQKELESVAYDAFLAGRGIIRLRFKSDIAEGGEGETEHDELKELVYEDGDSGESADDGYDGDSRKSRGSAGEGRENEQSVPYGLQRSDRSQPESDVEDSTVYGERITFEAISWRDYRHGPAKRWEDRPWEAFRHIIQKEDLDGFVDQSLYNAQAQPEDALADQDSKSESCIIWEVWCRKSKSVKFIKDNDGKILKRIDDPLGLTGFFPTATPVQPISLTGRLMPVNPYSIYRKLADEMDLLTRRIHHITSHMRVKGWYPGSATDLDNLLNGGDMDFVPIADGELWAQNGGMDGAIAFWPIERFVPVLQQLYASRDQAKAAIFEITGISDIVRGASMASETATAQNIKSQWGSLRIQKMQRDLARAARDLFVMMAEIIPSKFSAETLQQMTGIQLIPTEQDMMPLPPPPQPGPEQMQAMPPEQAQQMQQQAQQAMQEYQKAEQDRMKNLQKMAAINQLMGEKLQTYYRIDVESDSTVRADLTRQKQEVSEFLQGAGAYFQAVGPLVQQGMPADLAMEIFAANARMFNLGKSVEDAIEQALQIAKEASDQPQQPSPEQQKAQMEMEKMKADIQIQQQRAQADQQKAQADIQMKQADLALKQQEAQAKVAEMQAELSNERQKTALDMEQARADLAKTAADISKIQAEIERIEAQTGKEIVSTVNDAQRSMDSHIETVARVNGNDDNRQ